MSLSDRAWAFARAEAASELRRASASRSFRHARSDRICRSALVSSLTSRVETRAFRAASARDARCSARAFHAVHTASDAATGDHMPPNQ